MPANDGPAEPGPGGTAAERLRTVKEVSDYLGLATERVYDLIAAGELEAFDLAAPGAARRTYRVSPTHLADYLTRRKHAPAGGDQPGRV